MCQHCIHHASLCGEFAQKWLDSDLNIIAETVNLVGLATSLSKHVCFLVRDADIA